MNLLYIFADQWRAQAMGAAKGDDVQTPHMDYFAQESMAFDNAVSTYPLCSPHRASLLTGRYPYSCGMWTNCKIGLDETLMLKPQEITISDVLHEEGYRNAYIGKWHLDASEKNFTSRPISGAEEWDAYTPSGERRHHFDYWYSYGAMDRHLTPHYWQNCPVPVRPEVWSPQHETDTAIRYLENRDTNKPFCLFLSWNPPHPPYDLLPEKYRKQVEGREPAFRENVPKEWRKNQGFIKKFCDYHGAVEGLDDQFGRLMDSLKELGLEESTFVVLSADHGDCMGSHGLMGKNIWYEESIRIPFYLRGPGVRPGHSDALIGSQDHMPTLLELLGIPVPDTVEGRSYAACATGVETGNEAEEAFLCMIPGMPNLVEPYKRLGLNHKAFGWRGLRTKNKTYVVDNGTIPGWEQKRYLYNNNKDPYQISPEILLKGSREAVYYDGVLRGYLQKTGDPFLLSEENT